MLMGNGATCEACSTIRWWGKVVGVAVLLVAGCRANQRGVSGKESGDDARVASSKPSKKAPRAAASRGAVVNQGSAVARGAAVRGSKSRQIVWSWAKTPVGPMSVVTYVPAGADDEHRMPLLIAWHGQGEALKGPKRGARGWLDDYWLGRAVAHLHRGRVERSDFLGMVSSSQLDRANRQLRTHPFQGMIVMCPYTPIAPLRGDDGFENSRKLASFVADVLLPRARRTLPVLTGNVHVGIDGVSLGGRASLLIGLRRPELFGAVAGLQPAFETKDAPRLTAMAQAARRKNPRLRLRLVTSDRDFYLDSTKAIDAAWTHASVPHDMFIARGPHGYDFNRGPGAHWMLLYHDRALRGVSEP